MRPADLLRRAEDFLSRHGVDNPRGDAEVLLGSGGDAVGIRAEVHRVQVVLEDLLLGEPPFQLDGDGGFGHLALQSGFGPHEILLDHLLGDRRSALSGTAGHVFDQGASDTVAHRTGLP